MSRQHKIFDQYQLISKTKDNARSVHIDLKGRTGAFSRYFDGEHAFIVIAERVYRVRIEELG